MLAHPHPYLLQAGVEAGERGRGRAGRSDVEVKLCVASIAMETDSMPADDTT